MWEAELGVTVTSALSMLPASSVTETRTVNDPLAGATTVAVGAVEPFMVGGGVPLEPTTVHAAAHAVAASGAAAGCLQCHVLAGAPAGWQCHWLQSAAKLP
jgi:hypothetical protein